MSQLKFRAMYPKEGNDSMSGYALLEDGTLVKVVGTGDLVYIHSVVIQDERPEKKGPGIRGGF